MGNLLITGITGRSGKYFGNILIKNKFEGKIVALIRDENKFKNMFGQQNIIDYVIGDLTNEETIADIITKNQIETIFHIYNIKHSLNIVKSALSSGCVKRLILVHTTGIYSKYKSAGAEYLEIESKIFDMLKGSNISLTILRPTMIYGSLDDKNISTFIKLVDKFRIFPLVGGGKYELQPVNHVDLGNAYYQVLINPDITKNKNYTLSGGTVVYLKDILQNVSKLLHKKTWFVNVPFWLAYSAANIVCFLSFKKIDYREKVQRLVEPRAYTNTDAVNDFGYSPIDFYDGLKDEVKLYIDSKKQ